MQVQHVGDRIRGFDRVGALWHLWEMTTKDAQERLRILRFWDTHGLPATLDAFEVSRRTLDRWKAELRAQGGNAAALAAKGSAPRRRRRPRTDPRLVAEIRRLRPLHPHLGKEKLPVLRGPWCEEHGLPRPSVSTVGRILARAPDKRRFAPARLDARGRPRPLRRRPKTRKPRGVRPAALECRTGDTVERLHDGLRRDIVSFVDPASRLALAWAVPTKHARRTRWALDRTLSLFPKPPEVVLSDNASEFEAGFAETLAERGIRRWYTYPKSPKMNAHAERFNRILQESFVDDHEDLLFTDLALFNRKLAEWLVFTNTERPHQGLDQPSPRSFLLHHQPECQRWWTYTTS